MNGKLKQILAGVLVLTMLLSLCACGNDLTEPETTSETTAETGETTETTEETGGDVIESTMAPTEEPTTEPTEETSAPTEEPTTAPTEEPTTVPTGSNTTSTIVPTTGHTCADKNKDHKCDTCGKTLSSCADSNKDHKCDICGKTLSSCADGNKDHKCDTCGKTLSECADNDGDGKCDTCGTALTASEGLKFALNEDGKSYSVTDIGTCTDTDVVIPGTYNGLPVTSIEDSAFSNGCDNILSVTIPNGVTSIGDEAFFYCDMMSNITIPDSVTSIGEYVFLECGRLKDITFTGTMEQWNSIIKGDGWAPGQWLHGESESYHINDYTIHCTDGDITT